MGLQMDSEVLLAFTFVITNITIVGFTKVLHVSMLLQVGVWGRSMITHIAFEYQPIVFAVDMHFQILFGLSWEITLITHVFRIGFTSFCGSGSLLYILLDDIMFLPHVRMKQCVPFGDIITQIADQFRHVVMAVNVHLQILQIVATIDTLVTLVDALPWMLFFVMSNLEKQGSIWYFVFCGYWLLMINIILYFGIIFGFVIETRQIS